jgi:hypothetical protein
MATGISNNKYIINSSSVKQNKDKGLPVTWHAETEAI